MRMQRAIGSLLLPALFVVACSAEPKEQPAAGQTSPLQRPPAVASPEPFDKNQEPPPRAPQEKPSANEKPAPGERGLEARFVLFTGPLGFKFPEAMRELKPGEEVVAGLEPFDLDIRLPGLTEQAARQALKVEGAELLAEPAWIPGGGLALQVGKGQPEQVVTIRIAVTAKAPATLTIRRAAPATVTVDQRFGHTWKPITVLGAYTTPGPSAVRLVFSKPVRQKEVEQALLAAQAGPIRGLMEWSDEKTLTWQIAELPPRLDFLLGGAHDADGLPLPGGIPSLRLGDPPILVEVNLADPVDAVQGTLPPDLIAASLTRDAKVVNLLAWTPGTTKWDWQAVHLHFDRERKQLKSGRVEDPLPRLPANLENWVISPSNTLVAGLRSRGNSIESDKADLVIMDMRGGRSKNIPGVIGRFRGVDQVDLTTHLAWSPDSLQVAALSFAGDRERSDLLVIEAETGKSTVLVPNLPVRSDGTRLTWSNDGRWLLAGNLLIERETQAVVELMGAPHQASGAWEPGGTRLLYSPKDWGPIQIIDPAKAETKYLGDGMIVGWTGLDKVLLVRWPGSDTRYLPPGQQR